MSEFQPLPTGPDRVIRGFGPPLPPSVGLGEIGRQGLEVDLVWVDEAAQLVPAMTQHEAGGVPLQP